MQKHQTYSLHSVGALKGMLFSVQEDGNFVPRQALCHVCSLLGMRFQRGQM